ncbi:Restriction endonuclease, SacI family [uncultured Gammaproteobacteria bacterium]
MNSMPEVKSVRARPLDYGRAAAVMAETFQELETGLANGTDSKLESDLSAALDDLFRSATRSYRETVLGCVVARMVDPTIDVRHPYIDQGEHAFSGRQLDEKVINPFFQERRIPCSRGPYLATFRRGVSFIPGLPGQRDNRGYAAFLAVIDRLEVAEFDQALAILRLLLHRFLILRDQSNIPLSRIARLSVDQYDTLISGLLLIPSGGLLPLLIAVAAFKTLHRQCHPEWTVLFQGINVADKATGSGGDITIHGNDEKIILAIEVTERQIDRARVLSTFNAKIVPNGIADYIFFFISANPTEEARFLAKQYFAQGHELSFLPLKDWTVAILASLGPAGRAQFTAELLALLGGDDVPAALKVAWNDQIKAVIG